VRRLSRPQRRRWFGRSLGALVGLGAVMLPSGRVMQRRGVHIVRLELAGSRERVDRLLDQLGPEGRAAARTNLRLDQAWLFTYAAALALAAAEAQSEFSSRGWTGLARAGAVLTWAPILAGALDAVENTSLLALVDGSTSTALPKVAAGAAGMKFALVAATIPYGIAGLALSASPKGFCVVGPEGIR